MSIWIFFRLIGALALLMFGMKSMSDSLQKMAGPQLRHVLGTMTTNRLTGILSGTLITAAVQSSHLGTSHIGHHGCQYRNHPHRLDHECRLLVQHHRLCMAGFLLRHHPYL